MKDKVYFVTSRSCKPEKNSVCGHNDKDDYWVKTNLYSNEEKMFQAVLDKIVENELFDILIDSLAEELSPKINWSPDVSKEDILKIEEGARNIINDINNIILKMTNKNLLAFKNINSLDNLRDVFYKTNKELCVEDKKKIINICENYFDEIAFGIKYGEIKIE